MRNVRRYNPAISQPDRVFYQGFPAYSKGDVLKPHYHGSELVYSVNPHAVELRRMSLYNRIKSLRKCVERPLYFRV